MHTQCLAEWLQCSSFTTPSRPVTGFRLDSRAVQPGDVFVAFRGEHVDGHDFIQEAALRGASAVISEYRQEGVDVLQLVVPSTLHALAVLAARHRESLRVPVIALTGSNGKTTVKEMIAAILPASAFATRGNLNNQLGVPLSLLECHALHTYAVFELGANRPGDIAYTVAMVKPRVALVNNIAPAHIAGFGSLEGVARTKGEIYQGLAPDGIAVVNDDDRFAHFWDADLTDKKTLRFSLAKPVDVYAKAVRYTALGCAEGLFVTPGGEVFVSLQVPGEHSLRNALAATACAYAVGMRLEAIKAGLEGFKGVAGRMTFLPGRQHAVIIDDTYNANLYSVLSAIEVLAQRSGHRILVLGDMGELGVWTATHHTEIGEAAKARGIQRVLTWGQHSVATSDAFGEGGVHYATQSALLEALTPCLGPEVSVLVKGSRAAAMERIVQQLLEPTPC